MKMIKANPHFANLDKKTVMDALDAYDALYEGHEENEEDEPISFPENPHYPIVQEVERLIAGYSTFLEEYCRDHQEIPESALSHRPELPIEQVAFEIFTEVLHDSMMEEDDDE